MVWIVLFVTAGFMAVGYVGYTAVDALWLRKGRVKRRVDGLVPTRESKAAEVDPITQAMTSHGPMHSLFSALQRAGLSWRPSEFVALSVGLAVFLAVVLAVLLGSVQALVFGLIVGLAAPMVYLNSLRNRRLDMFKKQLPDALTMIAAALRSGYTFPRAMQVVSEEMPAPISREFARVINESNVGLTVEASLLRMLARVPVYDLELVVVAVNIQMQVGGNQAEILENIAETIRDRIRVQGEVTALTAEGRLSGVILSVLPFVMAALIALLNPKYLQPLIENPIGRWMIAAGICLQIVGAIVIKRLLVLDY